MGKLAKCRRRKFTYRNLSDAGSFFTPVASRIEQLQILLYPDTELSYLKGFTFYSLIMHNIIGFDRCFEMLAKAGEINSAYPLIRLQADNLKVLVAEYNYPNRILPTVYGKGKELTDIQIKGKNLKQSALNDAVEELFEGYKEIYQDYSLYVHPSAKHHLKWINKGVKDEETKAIRKAKRTIKRSPAQYDMIRLNQFIEDLLFTIYQRLLAEIKKDPVKFRKYKKWEEFSFTFPDDNEESQPN